MGPNDSNAKDLGRCYGECDKDSHCAYGLKCFQRKGTEAIPGCSGLGKVGWDYCYDPKIAEILVPTAKPTKPATTTTTTTTKKKNSLGGDNKSNAKDLKACWGECDKHSHCAKGLKCFQRDKQQKIPGCEGLGKTGWDYCYDPLHGGIKVLGGPNDSNAKDLGRCYGECDKDSHCAYGLKCFQRDKFEKIPGCSGVGKVGWDYCYDPLIAELLVPTTKKPTTTPAKTTKKKKQPGGDNNSNAKDLNACWGECDKHSH